MRLSAAAACFAALLLVVAVLPPGTALSHRVEYDAVGFGLQGNKLYAIELHWSGDCTRQYTIVVRDPTTLAATSRTFSGYQEHTHPNENPTQPVELHYSVDGFSTTPGVAFTIHGMMLDTVNNYPPLHLAGWFVGNYQGISLTLAVEPGPYTPTPVFC